MLKTKDLFVLTRIFKKLELKELLKEIVNRSENGSLDKEQIKKLQKEKGAEVVSLILENIDKIETELYEIVASYSDITPEEVKNQDPVKTINIVKEILKSELFQSFFKQAVK